MHACMYVVYVRTHVMLYVHTVEPVYYGHLRVDQKYRYSFAGLHNLMHLSIQ